MRNDRGAVAAARYFLPRISHQTMNTASSSATPASIRNHSIASLRVLCSVRRTIVAALLIVAGCATPPPVQEPPAPAPPRPLPPVAAPTGPLATPILPPPPPSATAAPTPQPVPSAPVARYEPASWIDLPDWFDPQTEAWPAWLRSCAVFRLQPQSSMWQRACAATAGIGANDAAAQRRYFESNFTPHRLANPDGATTGLVTGYYEPLLNGSRRRTQRFRYPLYGPPADLIAVDLGDVTPEVRDRRMRGRIIATSNGSKVIPYYTRAEITSGVAPVKGLEIAWVEDPVELFFLQVQGSGRLRLPDGSMMRVGYADHNGHPYRSIGRWLVDVGELPAEQASMQNIKAWVKRNPARADELLNQNPAFVFFREVAVANVDDGPNGSLGVPLIAGRSIAVDPKAIPLGAPVFLATTWPLSSRPLSRLVVAQDTGGAIRGAVRADFFWGFGGEAAEQAGRMRQPGRMWLLWPNGEPLPSE
jgi:membrane-bound lytic murein transglycosylase A